MDNSSSCDAAVLVATYNRARLLAATLESLAATRTPLRWRLVVVDNNSSDETRRVVEERAAHFPVPLVYMFEQRQGKSVALNTAIAAVTAPVIAFTDDDVCVPCEWLEQLCRPLFTRSDIDYTGGPVRPIWRAPKPKWLDERGNLGGTLAIKDDGPQPFIFEERRQIPLGVNMAVRRSLIDRIGGFRADLGPTGGRNAGKSLIGQEQAEFFCRSRAAGAQGLYVPTAALDHVVPASRLRRSYFRRWWFWKGVAHARLHHLHHRTELGVDLDRTPHVLGVPRFLYGNALRSVSRWSRALITGNTCERTTNAMKLAYFAGYLWDRQWQRRRDRDRSTVVARPV